MFFHRMKSQDIRVNLATEDYLMKNYETEEPILLMYIQNPCIIVGKHQNIYEEVALGNVEEDGVVLTRRLSGGGAVYDDLGNVSFSFVMKKGRTAFGDYVSITEPIVKALKEMGVKDISINGRNDLFIKDKKISGNAMYSKGEKMFSHGTLLYDVDLEKIKRYLTPSKEKLKTNHIQSVEARVTNIKSHLSKKYQQMTTEEFRDELIMRIFGVSSLEAIKEKEIKLSDEDAINIQKRVADIYGNQEFVYGSHQEFSLKRRAYIKNVGLVIAELEIEAGKIKDLSFSGDYFSQEDPNEVIEALIGKRLIFNELMKELELLAIGKYFTGLSRRDLVSLLLGEYSND